MNNFYPFWNVPNTNSHFLAGTSFFSHDSWIWSKTKLQNIIWTFAWDSKLTWKEYNITPWIEKYKHAKNNLCSQWSWPQNERRLYTEYVRPTLKYDITSWRLTASANLHKASIVENEALTIIRNVNKCTLFNHTFRLNTRRKPYRLHQKILKRISNLTPFQ